MDRNDISEYDLKALRNQITFLPKEVHLFEGTLRDNIDPLYHVNDDSLLAILKKLQFDKGEFKKDGLQMRINPVDCNCNLTREERSKIHFSRA